MKVLHIGSGAEFIINATHETEQGNEPWNVTAIAGSKMIAIIKTSKASQLAKFTYGIGDLNTIEVVDAELGKYLIRLQPSVSAKADPGDATIELKIFEPNDDFENDTFSTIGESDLVTFKPAVTSKFNVE